MKWQIALLLWCASAYGSSLSASGSASINCTSGLFGSTPFTLTDSSNTNPAGVSVPFCTLGGVGADTNAAAAYGDLSAGGNTGQLDLLALGSFQATSSFMDTITLLGGSEGATARIELTLNGSGCGDHPGAGDTSGTLQVSGQDVVSLAEHLGPLCPPAMVTSQSYDLALTPGQPVPLGATLSASGSSDVGFVVATSLTAGINILDGLPAGEFLVSQSGFDYTNMPETGTEALIGAGLLLIWAVRRKRT